MHATSEVEGIPPLWCDELPGHLRKDLRAGGVTAAIFATNPAAFSNKDRKRVSRSEKAWKPQGNQV